MSKVIKVDDFVELAGDSMLWVVAAIDGTCARIKAMTTTVIPDAWVDIADLTFVDME